MNKSVFILIMFMGLLSPNNSNGQTMNWALKHTISGKPFHEGLAPYIDKHMWGFINSSGEIVIPPSFEGVGNYSGGTTWAMTKTGWGIINRKGHFILQPNYDLIISNTKCPGVYAPTKDNKYGLFYNGRLILPVKYKYVFIDDYPFVQFGETYEKHHILNILTGEIFDLFTKQGKIVICEKDARKYYYDAITGEQIDSTLYQESSKGIIAFRDEHTKLYGFKNRKTGQLIVKPKFQKLKNTIWISDMMIAIDSINMNIPQKETLIDCNGQEHLLGSTGKEELRIMGKYVRLSIWNKEQTSYALFDKYGKQLIPLTNNNIYSMDGDEDWINISGTQRKVFDAINNVYYPGFVLYVKDNMIAVHNDTCSYFINATTRKRIKGEYYQIYDFSEGLAKVRLSKDVYDVAFIDKKGKIILKGDKNLHFEDHFSEGVVGAYNCPHNREDTYYGYIYNPLGHGGYTYNASDKMAVDRFVLETWNKKGHEAFEKEQYGIAKDYYYRVMMNDPTDVNAVINYGAALGNLGYYDEAIESCRIALDIDPDNQLAKDNLRINLDNKRKEEERQQQVEEDEREERSTKSSTFWDALGNFANILSSVAGGTSVYQPYSSFSMDADYSPSYSNSGGSNHDYQSEYNKWANLAERHYNSLTNLGYRVKHKDGSRSGGTLSSMSGSKYVQMKKSLRDAQHEMQRIRRKAAQNGVTINPSTWETATVGY